MRKVSLNIEEQKAIASLERLAKKWPKSLMLFSWSGSLTVLKNDEHGFKCDVGCIPGISNDGGDPSDDEIDQNATVTYL